MIFTWSLHTLVGYFSCAWTRSSLRAFPTPTTCLSVGTNGFLSFDLEHMSWPTGVLKSGDNGRIPLLLQGLWKAIYNFRMEGSDQEISLRASFVQTSFKGHTFMNVISFKTRHGSCLVKISLARSKLLLFISLKEAGNF